jgi:putative phosphoribosyl transferase
MGTNMIFENRISAARALIPYLEKYKNEEVVVLAIPRGGVPMGYEIAEHFGWPLNLLLTKKIGHPMNKEYAIGAVSLDGVVLDSGHQDVPEFYVKSESRRIRNLLQDRFEKFTGGRKQESLKGKAVIIVDDGIATGYTMKASIEMLKKKEPLKIIVAVPVASPRIINAIRNFVDDVIVLEAPEDFMGVGQFYEDFSEVTDDDVMKCLNKVGV